MDHLDLSFCSMLETWPFKENRSENSDVGHSVWGDTLCPNLSMDGDGGKAVHPHAILGLRGARLCRS
jgi:hypothetical protein